MISIKRNISINLRNSLKTKNKLIISIKQIHKNKYFRILYHKRIIIESEKQWEKNMKTKKFITK